MILEDTPLELRQLALNVSKKSLDEINNTPLEKLIETYAKGTKIIEEKNWFDVTYKGKTVRFYAGSEKCLRYEIRKEFDVAKIRKDMIIKPAEFLVDWDDPKNSIKPSKMLKLKT